jgi:hypothetical protein
MSDWRWEPRQQPVEAFGLPRHANQQRRRIRNSLDSGMTALVAIALVLVPLPSQGFTSSPTKPLRRAIRVDQHQRSFRSHEFPFFLSRSNDQAWTRARENRHGSQGLYDRPPRPANLARRSRERHREASRIVLSSAFLAAGNDSDTDSNRTDNDEVVPKPQTVMNKDAASLISASYFILVDIVFRRVFRMAQISFPSSLGACGALFITLLLLPSQTADRLVTNRLRPG